MTDRDEFEAWFESDEANDTRDMPEDYWVGDWDNVMIPRAWKAARRWRPIEDAPQDEDVLLYAPSKHRLNNGKPSSFRVWIGAPRWAVGNEPTHWQPLPPPPEE